MLTITALVGESHKWQVQPTSNRQPGQGLWVRFPPLPPFTTDGDVAKLENAVSLKLTGEIALGVRIPPSPPTFGCHL
jgi:hypothetical protein